jgi:FtsH-binding integral membrane protein
MINDKLKYNKEDLLGIASSFICLIHCHLSIFFFLFGFQVILDEKKYGWINYIFLFLSFVAVHHTIQTTSSRLIRICLMVFFSLLAFGVLFHDDFKEGDFFSIVGSIGLMLTHVWNMRYCKICKK